MNGAAKVVTTDSKTKLNVREVAHFLARAVDANGSRSAANDGASLDDVIADLVKLGLPPGGVVILALSNGVHLVTQYFAALLLGLVPLAISPAIPSARIIKLSRHIGAHMLIATRLDPARYSSGTVHRVGSGQAVLLHEQDGSAYKPGEVLILTSGTSGMFSSCVHHVGSLLRNAQRHAESVGLRAEDVLLVNLPLHYAYAIVAQTFAALVSGARLVVSGPPFAPTSYRSTITGYGVTSSSITPTIARMLLTQVEPLPPTLRMLTVGGDRIAPEQVSEMLSLNPSGELYITYGLTEAGPRVATLAAHQEPGRRHSSVGLPLTGVRTILREEKVGEGELLVASDTVLLRKVGATAPHAHKTIVSPGVIATGDVFHIDEDGYLYFRGRLSDFVVVRGEKVSLFSVRQAAHAIPGVLRCIPRVEIVENGTTCLDLEVYVSDPDGDTEQRVRRALNSFLLPSERPRHIVVGAADPTVFQK